MFFLLVFINFFYFFICRYFIYILFLLLIEGLFVFIFFFIFYFFDLWVLSCELMFFLMRVMVFGGVIGLCLLVSFYRMEGLSFIRL